MTSQQRRRAAIKSKQVSDSRIPPLVGFHGRRGRAPQKIGMWGNVSMDYRTAATHDRRWSVTVSEAK